MAATARGQSGINKKLEFLISILQRSTNMIKRNNYNEDIVAGEILKGISGSSSNFNNSEDRILYINDYIESSTIQNIIESIIEYNKEDDYQEKLYALDNHTYHRKPITIYVNTYGGSVYDGLSLVGVIQTSKTPVHTVASGKVMSMGVIIALAGHCRYATPFTTFMIHSVSSFTWGQVKDMEENVVETKRIHNVLMDFIKSNTKITSKKLKKIYKSKQDYYFDTDVAIALDFVQKVI